MIILLRAMLMILSLTISALIWLKIRKIFDDSQESFVLRHICGIVYGILTLFVTWILCRSKDVAMRFNNSITDFCRREELFYIVKLLSLIVLLGYLIVAYLRFKRWYQ